MTKDPPEWLTQTEISNLVLAAIDGRGGEATREQIEAVVEWAEHIRIDVAILESVLAGDLDLRRNADDTDWELLHRTEKRVQYPRSVAASR